MDHPKEMNSLPDWDGRDLAALLALRKIGADCFANRYADHNLNGAMFGGQLIGQAMMSALLTVATTRAPHAVHATFLRPGSGLRPLEYTVERSRDGGRFSHRRVVVTQENRSIFTADVSFHDGETGDDQAHSLHVDVPPPDQLPTMDAIVSRHGPRLPPAVSRRMARPRGTVDVRVANLETLTSRKSSDETVMYWLRVAQPLPDDACWHAASLGYLSDYWMAAPFRMLPGAPHHPGEVAVSSLNHALWIHRPFRADAWLLVVNDIPSEQHGRRLNRSQIFDRDGRLVASSAQEALMRLID